MKDDPRACNGMNQANSPYFSPWSPDGTHPVSFLLACSACKIIWPIHIPRRSFPHSVPNELREKCPKCREEELAIPAGLSGEAADFYVALRANELQLAKEAAHDEGDYVAWVCFGLLHNYLDLRILLWETGGPEPCDLQQTSCPSEEEFFKAHAPMLHELEKLVEEEEFWADVIDSRLNVRMESMLKAAVSIPNEARTATAYDNLLDRIIEKHGLRKTGNLTATDMLRCPHPGSSLLSRDALRGFIAQTKWNRLFVAVLKSILVDENDRFRQQKLNRSRNSLRETVIEAKSGDDKAMFRLIQWDRIWLACPWVNQRIIKNAYNRDFIESLAEACSGIPGHMPQAAREQLRQAEDDCRAIIDLFGAAMTGDTSLLQTFTDEAESFPKDYSETGGNYANDVKNFRKFLKRRRIIR